MSLEEEEIKIFKNWDVEIIWLLKTFKNIFFVKEREYK